MIEEYEGYFHVEINDLINFYNKLDSDDKEEFLEQLVDCIQKYLKLTKNRSPNYYNFSKYPIKIDNITQGTILMHFLNLFYILYFGYDRISGTSKIVDFIFKHGGDLDYDDFNLVKFFNKLSSDDKDIFIKNLTDDWNYNKNI
jgi:hypothetical protein